MKKNQPELLVNKNIVKLLEKVNKKSGRVIFISGGGTGEEKNKLPDLKNPIDYKHMI